MTRTLTSVLALTAALTLSACGAPSGGTTDTSDAAGSATSAADAPSGSASEDHNDADVTFAQQMIPHHRQAVAMSGMLLDADGVSPGVADLATRIQAAQDPEIGTMTGWLEAWGEPVEAEGGMTGHDMGSHSDEDAESMEGMAGMMTEDQLAELDAAEGEEASRLFLESMTAHHEGAVAMAQEEVDSGQYQEALDLAGSIVETQQAEIDEMQELLAGL